MKHKSKSKVLYVKAVILLVCFILVIRIFTLALSKYESQVEANANVDIAFYLLKEDYQTMTLNLDSVLPQENKYVYYFSIGNQDGEKRAQIDLEYNLKIRTTTNLPITYNLYENASEGKINVITSNTVDKDEYGTYFRNIQTAAVTLRYKTPETRYYQLEVSFPQNYNTTNYQDIIELIEITVSSHQLVQY